MKSIMVDIRQLMVPKLGSMVTPKGVFFDRLQSHGQKRLVV